MTLQDLGNKATKEEDYQMAIILMGFMLAAVLASWLTKWGFFEAFGVLAFMGVCLALILCLL
jgi:hypothetical protein